MKVIAMVQSTFSPDVAAPVTFYNGDDLAQAMHGVITAMSSYNSDLGYTRLLSVRVDFDG
jgi:hypothetical protein